MNEEYIYSQPAVLLCGHGSRTPEGAAEFSILVENIKKRLPGREIAPAFLEHSFLEHNRPGIMAALQGLYDQGVRDIIIQPVTLYNAGHTRLDIPEILARFQKKHPDCRLQYGSALGLIPPVIEAAGRAALSVMPDVAADECKLLLVGRGTRDRMVADQTIDLCRRLHLRLDFGDSRYCYYSENAPLLTAALTQAARSHYHHVIILPYLLFSGHLLSAIYREVDAARKKYPDFTFHKAPPLGMLDYMTEAVIAKINEAGG